MHSVRTLTVQEKVFWGSGFGDRPKGRGWDFFSWIQNLAVALGHMIKIVKIAHIGLPLYHLSAHLVPYSSVTQDYLHGAVSTGALSQMLGPPLCHAKILTSGRLN